MYADDVDEVPVPVLMSEATVFAVRVLVNVLVMSFLVEIVT